jgi:hypothetical protein
MLLAQELIFRRKIIKSIFLRKIVSSQSIELLSCPAINMRLRIWGQMRG